MAEPLEGKIALVSGASRGLGKAIALELAAAGMHVVCTGRSTAERSTQSRVAGLTIDAVGEEIRAAGGSASSMRCDHTDPAEVDALIRDIASNHGKLDVLVNNAWGGHDWSALGWTNEQLVAFAEGVHVTTDAQAGVG
jgi:NAD(P)-dependent dehydrogenase (short-subunit alcohol dehydrogenase family)